MKRVESIVFGFCLIAAVVTAPPASWAQQGATAAQGGHTAAAACAKVWIGHEAEIEEFLRTAPILTVTDVPIGVTKPKRVSFAPGGPVASGAWKPLAPGMRQGYYESYKAEIAAYEMDKLLGLHMVPPYVERRIGGDLGAVALWVENVHTWEVDHPVKGPDPASWDRQVVDMKMFDQLIGNTDRNQGNLLYDDEYHLILIDHSRAFTGEKDLTKMSRLSHVDRQVWEKMLALDETELEQALGKWLDKGKRKAILQRRDEMKKTIDALVAQKGEAGVFLAEAALAK